MFQIVKILKMAFMLEHTVSSIAIYEFCNKDYHQNDVFT